MAREPGLQDLPPADGFYPNRRDTAKHTGALKRVPVNRQSVGRFTDQTDARTITSGGSNPMAGYKKSETGKIQQPQTPVQPI